MCGIVGVMNLDGAQVPSALLKKMTDIIAHRGPDGEGQYLDGATGLGHRRLTILDLSTAGAQPMEDDRGELVITYNGEVYNFGELRRELEGKGHRFHSRTDTEVVLHAYREWGTACLERFNGMFAFAIWDRRRRELFLARDRYGVKPLYYALQGKTFLFASEVKAFLPHPAFRAAISLPHLLEYFTFQNIFTDGTLFRGVTLLPPASWIRISAEGSLERRQYWDFEFREDARERGDAEYERELEGLIVRAVERQLVSDAEVGAYLSGGLDSGSITAIASRKRSPFYTFTVGFDLSSAAGLELGMDERAKAETLAGIFHTEQYEVVLKAGDMVRCLPKLVWHLEDLRVGQCYPNFYSSRLASKFVKSILSGTGGDELFAGYPWRYYRAVVNDDFDHYVEKYYKFWHRLIPNRHVKELFVPEVWREIQGLQTIDVFRKVLAGHGPVPSSPKEYVQQSLYFEAKTFLPGLLLMEDKLAMAHSLEARVPFLDNDLVDFSLGVPVRLKLRELEEVVRINENEVRSKKDLYFSQTRDGKMLLRKVLSSYVPAETVNQIKQGFSGPDASWFKGPSLEYVRSIVHDSSSAIYQFLRPDTTQKLVDEHLNGTTNRRLFIWSLLCFEEWCRQFLGAARSPA